MLGLLGLGRVTAQLVTPVPRALLVVARPHRLSIGHELIPRCHSPGAVEVESVGTDVDDAIEAFFEPSPRLSQHGRIGRDHVMVGVRASGVGIDLEVGDQLGREDERLVGA